MRFKSPTDTPISIGLTSGHMCSIGPEFTEVDKRFHRDAVAQGAILEGLEDEAPAANSDAGKTELILAAIRAMVANPKEGDFTGDGKPAVGKVSAHAGFTVTRGERDDAWAVVCDEQDADEAGAAG